MLSRSPPNPEHGSRLLATYRCSEPSNRVQFRVRGIEGQYGDLNIMVVARLSPKTAQSVVMPIKPLSLHHRCAPLLQLRTLPLRPLLPPLLTSPRAAQHARGGRGAPA